MSYRTAGDVARLTLPQGKAEVFHFDERCRGLSVRLHGASRSYVVWYSINSRRRKITLGATDSMTLDEARRRAGEIINKARDGVDAGAERQAARATTIYRMRDLVRDYLADHAAQNLRPRTLADVRRHLERHLAPLHAVPVADVNRKVVAAQLLALSRSVSPVLADKVRTTLSATFAWGIRTGLVDGHNPVIGTHRGKPPVRERVLSRDELDAIWTATADATPYSKVVRLLILTGCRREEVGGMMWDELDGDVWHLPGARSKNGRPRDIALSTQAREIIESVPRTGDFLFGRAGRNAFSAWSWGKAALDAQLKLPEWRLHDVRRSMATALAEQGIAQPHIIEAILGHLRSGSQAGIAGIYNRATYVPEQRAALERWAGILPYNSNNAVNIESASQLK